MKKFFYDPVKCIRFTFVISVAVHLAVICDWGLSRKAESQIILPSRKAQLTEINYTKMRLRWDELRPEKRLRSNGGQIPSLFKKKMKLRPGVRQSQARVSLSREAVQAKKSYETEVLKKIHRMKYYPLSARRFGREGNVKLRFTVDKNGKIIGAVDVVEKCSHDILNRAGKSTIRSANPFPPFPGIVAEEKERITFTVVVNYSLKS